ncbi:MAG: hypothetical protein AVDCRST_MAG56-10 [uncultured Cytophagales bacterium]|uniref:DUF4249 domain-containing protein n=1 Tax=uncultured Cytophagales bacterium TaxID=158755 RepID=A0A6J4H4C1_9SPHI|nr:MAG: hypothetical protein AVDCRST_MAG56-10 [uncultured Cytophagales bacterium]
MNRLKNGLLLALVCLLAACEKEVTSLKLPGADSQLVVNAFISPQDTVLEVAVYESKPVVGERPGSASDIIRDATVTLSDGEKTVVLPLLDPTPDLRRTSYRTRPEALPIEAGKTYYLQVSTPDGRLVTAQCTVPAAPPATQIRLDSVVRTLENGAAFRNYTGTLYWQDLAGEENFYRVDADLKRVRVDNWSGKLLEDWQSVNWSPDKATFFSDARLDGAQFSSPEINFSMHDYFRSTTLYAYLLHTDRAYFEYHRTLRANADSNPFAEPVLLYSNVAGGLGVFAAYNRTTFEFTFQ